MTTPFRTAAPPDAPAKVPDPLTEHRTQLERQFTGTPLPIMTRRVERVGLVLVDILGELKRANDLRERPLPTEPDAVVSYLRTELNTFGSADYGHKLTKFGLGVALEFLAEYRRANRR